MNVKTAVSLMRGGRLLVLLRLKVLFTCFYRLCFLASMADTAVLIKLSRGRATVEGLAGASAKDPSVCNALKAWLELGIHLGLVRQDASGYSLRGFLAKRLAAPGSDPIRALVREVAGLHHHYIVQTPGRLEQGLTWDPSHPHGGYGDIIARSSRTLEPFLVEVIDRFFPPSGRVRLLEVGCGHAAHIAYAARRNDGLTAVGLELDPRVAEAARSTVRAMDLKDRVEIEVEDVRTYRPDGVFDVLTLYNNIYYFPVQERIELLRHLRDLLGPNGRILLTTGCAGGSIEFELVNLIHASTRGWGRLPGKDELLQQMTVAGFERACAMELIPGNKYYAFVGHCSG